MELAIAPVKPSSSADRLRVELAARSRPGPRRRAATARRARPSRASRSTSRPNAWACLASSWPNDTGWACCRWVKPGAGQSACAPRPGRRAPRTQVDQGRGDRPATGRAGTAAGRWPPGRCGCGRRAACRRRGPSSSIRPRSSAVCTSSSSGGGDEGARGDLRGQRVQGGQHLRRARRRRAARPGAARRRAPGSAAGRRAPAASRSAPTGSARPSPATGRR